MVKAREKKVFGGGMLQNISSKVNLTLHTSVKKGSRGYNSYVSLNMGFMGFKKVYIRTRCQSIDLTVTLIRYICRSAFTKFFPQKFQVFQVEKCLNYFMFVHF